MVSRSCSALISPKPLKRVICGFLFLPLFSRFAQARHYQAHTPPLCQYQRGSGGIATYKCPASTTALKCLTNSAHTAWQYAVHPNRHPPKYRFYHNAVRSSRRNQDQRQWQWRCCGPFTGSTVWATLPTCSKSCLQGITLGSDGHGLVLPSHLPNPSTKNSCAISQITATIRQFAWQLVLG